MEGEPKQEVLEDKISVEQAIKDVQRKLSNLLNEIRELQPRIASRSFSDQEGARALMKIKEEMFEEADKLEDELKQLNNRMTSI